MVHFSIPVGDNDSGLGDRSCSKDQHPHPYGSAMHCTQRDQSDAPSDLSDDTSAKSALSQHAPCQRWWQVAAHAHAPIRSAPPLSSIDAGQSTAPSTLPQPRCQWNPKRYGKTSLQVRGYIGVSKSAQSQHRRRYAGKRADSRGPCGTPWSRPPQRLGWRPDASCGTTVQPPLQAQAPVDSHRVE